MVETTEVKVLRVADVDLAFARDEGEGFHSVEEWRSAHASFWAGDEISDDTLVVAVALPARRDAPKLVIQVTSG